VGASVFYRKVDPWGISFCEALFLQKSAKIVKKGFEMGVFP
jgi:hypothetical protein